MHPQTASDVTLRPSSRSMVGEISMQTYRDFRAAFALMSLIPILVSTYLLAGRLFTMEILYGVTGLFFLLAVGIALLGMLVGRQVIQRILTQLMEANAALRQFDVMKTSFVTNIAYEFRPPLAAISLSLKNLSDGLLGSLTESQQKTIQDCHQTAERLTRLTSDLLKLTEFEVVSKTTGERFAPGARQTTT